MKLLMGMIAAVALMLTSQAFAAGKVDMAAGQALAQKSGCMGCHKVDGKLVGPGLKDVAAKYKGNKKAEEMLVAKVTKGGSGVWGAIPMPPNAAVKPADMKTLVQWVLAQ
ncbi:MAG: cytochrome C [Gallionellales bacterium 35-53-114]|jgi:cytochrome c|nr:MAG: cytochrome C [Gallionellales bacterium 35-53-114]OYZ64692.1 MAG: cytochrome C [Gallionellales bacterium 24-53-125]OZB07769.1 MAG: cytochrome C [Gallionellales bacterium 39-52-133]HQS58519.1 c-type cytochrome [Gallionellaceae bacterium]HQS74860.1 c-type cytochrome [Gallionellaceae bacterium]